MGRLNEWLMASLGANALLVFALLGSPMAQSWAVVVYNTLSALVGISYFHLISQPLLALPMTASLSVWECLSCAACIHQLRLWP